MEGSKFFGRRNKRPGNLLRASSVEAGSSDRLRGGSWAKVRSSVEVWRRSAPEYFSNRLGDRGTSSASLAAPKTSAGAFQ